MPVKFRKTILSGERYESAGIFDVNGNGTLDIVSGAYWYEGPDIRTVHDVGTVMPVGEWYDDFSTIPMDINGNGRNDFVTGGWWGNTLRWRENPGDPGDEWSEHIIAECGSIETTRAWDVDGDGVVQKQACHRPKRERGQPRDATAWAARDDVKAQPQRSSGSQKV